MKNEKSGSVPKGDRSLLLAVGIGILVFGGVFFFLRSALQPAETVVNGILIQSASPQADIAAVLSPTNIVEQIGTASEQEFLPGRSAAATEIASALATARKNVTVQGIIAGKYCVNAGKERIPCLHPQVLVNYSTCNCIRVEDGTVKVLGTDAWMFEKGPKIRGVINWALGK